MSLRPLPGAVPGDNLKTFAKAFANSLVREQPDRYIAQPGKAKRAGKIYIDYLRNESGATAIRRIPRGHDPERLSRHLLHGMSFRIHCGPCSSICKRCPSGSESMKHDPWQRFFGVRQSLTKDMQQRIDRT